MDPSWHLVDHLWVTTGSPPAAAAVNWQEGRKIKEKKPLSSIVLGEQEPLALNFGMRLRHPGGALPTPAAPLLFLRLGRAAGSFPRRAPAAKGLLSPLKGSQRNAKRERERRKWGFQLWSSPGNNILLCLYCLIFFFLIIFFFFSPTQQATGSDVVPRALLLCTNILQ